MDSAPVQLLRPVVALTGWTFAIESWMYYQRLPVVTKMNLTPSSTKADMDNRTPAYIRWKVDNYNHLHEAPTTYYAIMLAFSVLSSVTRKTDMSTDIKLGWIYVALRVLHSLVHCLANPITTRFGIFLMSEGVKLALALRLGSSVFRA